MRCARESNLGDVRCVCKYSLSISLSILSQNKDILTLFVSFNQTTIYCQFQTYLDPHIRTCTSIIVFCMFFKIRACMWVCMNVCIVCIVCISHKFQCKVVFFSFFSFFPFFFFFISFFVFRSYQ